MQDQQAVSSFNQHIKTAFKYYDSKDKNYLDPLELRKFINEIRFSLNLHKCDKSIFKRICDVIDENSDGQIELGEL